MGGRERISIVSHIHSGPPRPTGIAGASILPLIVFVRKKYDVVACRGCGSEKRRKLDHPGAWGRKTVPETRDSQRKVEQKLHSKFANTSATCRYERRYRSFDIEARYKSVYRAISCLTLRRTSCHSSDALVPRQYHMFL